MEFDATTFALEVVNFLVLLWLLQRLLYKPVSGAIARRQASIDLAISEGERMRGAAQALKQQLDNRLADWERERDALRQRLRDDIDTERARLMSSLRAELDDERARRRAIDEQHAGEQRVRLRADALHEGARFVAHLLGRLAGAELQERIGLLLLDDLGQLGPAERRALQAVSGDADARIASAYPLIEGQRAPLQRALEQVVGRPLVCDFVQAPELIAGLRVGIGPWVLRCNLKDELGFFAERYGHA